MCCNKHKSKNFEAMKKFVTSFLCLLEQSMKYRIECSRTKTETVDDNSRI
jgi:hypothetical protein